MGQKVEDAVVQKLANFMVNNIVEQCGYLCNYKSNIKNLKKEVIELVDVGRAVDLDIAATRRKLEVIGPNTVRWVEDVGKIENKADKVFTRAKKFEKSCFKGRLNLKKRHLLSREATKLIDKVGKHRRKAPKDIKLAHDALPAAMLPAQSNGGFQGLQSRTSTIEKVLEDLENDQYNVIGICGMTGVGKTWLVDEVLSIVSKNQSFHDYGKVVVSEKPLAQVQGDVADMLGLPLKETSEHARARKLHQRLTNGSKILLIFDNVLEPFQLRDVGFPATGDHKGLKVLFTSQKEGAQSPIQAQKYVTLEVLPPPEARVLFKEMAGECVETSELHSIAADVLAECGGLPIAIVILGRALENGDMHDWENARHQLKSSTVTTFPDIHTLVYKPIQLSYNLLGSRQTQAQRLLMLCCLFPKDANIPVEKLIRYAKGLQLSEDVENYAGTTHRVMVLLKELKSCFLLLPGDKDTTVKMHNVVRSVCLSIASKNNHASEITHPYMVKHHPEMNTWPNKDDHETYKAISLTLTSDNQMHKLPENLYYPNLELLQLLFRCDSLNIPKDFFHGMKEVKVLDFKQLSRWGKFLRIDGIPPNTEYLSNLRTLSLEFCDLSGEDLILIGHLKQLEILSFFSSKIEELPPQIMELTSLKLLDLRCANGPKFIPSGVLSSMTKLEDLYMGNYDSWFLEGQQSDQTKGVCISELSGLSLLNVLQVRVKDPTLLLELNEKFWLKRLRRFQIAAIRKLLSFREYEIGQSLTFDGVDWTSLSEGNISSLLNRAECLTLKATTFNKLFSVCENLKTVDFYGCDGVKFIMEASNSSISLSKLKRMEIRSMDDLEGICDGDLPSDSLVDLETVKLDSLPELMHLWRAPLDSGCLGKLRVLEMSHCEAVTSIFSYAVAKCLVQLQKLDIKNCEMLEGVVSNVGGASEKIKFPKLSFLSLDELPKFRGFFPESDVEDLNSLTMEDVPLERKTTANQKKVGCGWFTRKRRAVRTEEHPIVKPLHHEESSIELFSQLVELPRLNKLLVRSMDDVKHIVDSQTHRKSVSELRVVHVDGCEELLNLAASDAIRLLQSLEQVRVQNCGSLESVFDFRWRTYPKENAVSFLSKLEMISLHNLNNLKHVWAMAPEENQGFKMLRSLEISSCDNLTYVFSLSVAKMLDNLQELRVKGSSMVEEIIQSDGDPSELTDTLRFPRLQSLQLDDLSSLASFSSGNHDFEFPELQNVLIKECPNMSYFCRGQVTAQRLKKIQVGDHVDEWAWKGDFKITIRDLHYERLESGSEEIEEEEQRESTISLSLFLSVKEPRW